MQIKRAIALFTLVLLVVVGAYFSGRVSGWNPLQSKVTAAIGEDPRNAGVVVKVSKGSDGLYYDLRDPGQGKSPADIFRVFLAVASALKDESFDRVYLCRRGAVRYWIPGSYWHELGASYGTENVIYQVRTFPEQLRKPDGSNAFEKWEGGFLGVAKEQMEDFNEFMRLWVAE